MKELRGLFFQEAKVKPPYLFYKWLMAHDPKGNAPSDRVANTVRFLRKNLLDKEPWPDKTILLSEWESWFVRKSVDSEIVRMLKWAHEEYLVFLRLGAGADIAIRDSGKISFQEKLFD